MVSYLRLQIIGNQRVHNGIVDCSVNDVAVSLNSLSRRSRFFCDSLAGEITNGCHDFEAGEAELEEREPSDKPHGRRGYALPSSARPYPIAEVGEVVNPIYLIQRAAAEKRLVVFIKHREVKFESLRPRIGS